MVIISQLDANGGERKGIRARNYFFFSIHNLLLFTGMRKYL